jgi:hypothetical protein
MKSLKILWNELLAANAAVLKEHRAAIRKGGFPPSHAPGSAIAKSKQAYHAFWNVSGAEEYARKQIG